MARVLGGNDVKLWHFEYEGLHYYREAEKDQYSSATLAGQYRGDGVDFERSVGSTIWYHLPTVLGILTKRIPAQRTRTGYRLKEGYPESILTPAEIPDPKYFDPDCGDFDYSRREVASLYEEVCDVTPESWEPEEYDVVEVMAGGAPREPKYRGTTWNLGDTVGLATRAHKPCWLPGEAVYQLVRTAVKNNLPHRCRMSYDNDSWFTVEAEIPLAHEESEIHVVTEGRGRSKRDVKRIVPLRSMNTIVLQMNKDGKYAYGKTAPTIKGDNLDELEANVSAYIDAQIEALQKANIAVCPNCNGYGYKLTPGTA